MHQMPDRFLQKIRPRHFAVLLLLWWILCWLLTGTYFERKTATALESETAQAERFVANLAQGFDRIVNVRLGMPNLLARDPAFRAMLKQAVPMTTGATLPHAERQRLWTRDPALAAASRRLKTDADDLHLTALALVDPAGNCIAASNAGTELSWIGVNYGDREYFPEILAGRSGYRMNIGKQYGAAGIVFFAPIMDHDKVLGAVIAKMDLTTFGNWLATADAFVADRNGVILLARDPALLLRAMSDAPVHRLDAAQRRNLYRQAELLLMRGASWGDANFPELRRVEGREHPVIHRFQSVSVGNEPIVHAFWPFPQLAEFETRRRQAALGFSVAGILAMFLISTLAATRRNQRKHLEALAQREQEFRSLAESSPDFVIRYDLAHRMRYLNEKLMRELRLASTDEVVGRMPIEVWPDGRFAAIDAAAERARENGETVAIELGVTEKDGKPGFRQIVVVPEYDAGGSLVGTLAFGRDITKFKQSEAAGEAALAEAQALARLRQDFLSHMSHELRTPLNSILGHAQVLQADATLSKRQATAVAAIRDDGTRLLETIDDILDLTGIEGEQTKLLPMNIPLARFMDDIGRQFDAEARRKGLVFSLQLASGLPATVHGDPRRLRQVLTKLLDNAIKFTANGRIELRVELTREGQLGFTVNDTGDGIDPARLTTLFAPFAPGGELLRRRSGSGLGLAIGQHLVRLMGSELRAHSRPGEGSTFHFDLALTGASTPDAVPPAPTFHPVPAAATEALESPPAEALQTLHRLAQLGNMRDILRETDRLTALAPNYHPFAERLRQMAESYQSKALLAFVEACLAAPTQNEKP